MNKTNRYLMLALMAIVLTSSFAMSAQPSVITPVSDIGASLLVVLPDRDTLKMGRDYTLHTHLFNYSANPIGGYNASCQIHIYNESGRHVIEAEMGRDSNGMEYYYTFNGTKETSISQRISVLVYCEGNNTYLNQYGFEKKGYDITINGKEEVKTTPVGGLVAVIIIPLVLAFLLLLGSMSLDPEEHNFFRIFLFLASIVGVIISAWFASLVVNNYYQLELMGNAMADFTFWTGIFLFIMVAYVLIWIFAKLIHKSAQRRNE